ncbi:C10 family peptidase [Parabacteroides sp. Marseille-P3160]|uniref:C10 family peptidase n=1 Tax=Parabacteroides sp. Marseille-P3160 TaxID=1917887 RepID=UPI0009BC4983|nr:C10 family peptidase [Parabacteroides sp. Marseille-P3160]
MKRNYLFLSAFIVLFSVISCTESTEFIEEENANIENKSDFLNSPTVTKAIQLVSDFSAKNQSLTKSSTQNININKDNERIEVIDVDSTLYHFNITNKQGVLETENLKSLDNDSFTLYTVYFKQNKKKGFSIVSSDERLNQVYAYTEDGNLSDTVYNKALAGILYNIPLICQEQLIKYDETSTKQITKSTSSNFYINVGPNIITQWHQGYPFNIYTPAGNGCSHCPAGCTAIALAQAIAALNAPASRLNGRFDFEALTNASFPSADYYNMAGDLAKYIGDLVGMNYSCDGSGAWAHDICNTFDTWRISYIFRNGNIDYGELLNTTANGHYDVTAGFQKKGEKAGHTWVICGVRGYVKSEGGKYVAVDDSQMSYYCNWGWSGSSDGWYVYTNVEQPTNIDYPFIKDNEQLYIKGILGQ